MQTPMSTEQLSDRLGQVCRHWEYRRDQPSQPGLTIALAREAGTPASEVAQALGQRLNWPVYDRELLEQIAQAMGLRTSLLETVDEKRVDWLVESMQALLAVPQVNEAVYLRHLVKTMLALGMHGRCIIMGRGAAHILAPAMTLRVRLVAPLHERITRFAREARVGHDEAARQVAALDRARVDFVRQHFLVDATNPEHYDLVLNVERFAPAACAQIIVEALQRRLVSQTSEGLKTSEAQFSASVEA